MSVKYHLILFSLFIIFASCNDKTVENGVEEPSTKMDYPFFAEVRIILDSSPYNNGDHYNYSEKGFSELIHSKELFDQALIEVGLDSDYAENEITIKKLPNSEIIITVNAADLTCSKAFLKELMILSFDSIIQSVIQPINDSLVIIDDAVANEMSMINEVDLYENDYNKSYDAYRKLMELRSNLTIQKSGVVSPFKVVSWDFWED